MDKKELKDRYIVDLDFLNKNYVEYSKKKTINDIMQIDADSK